MSAMISLNRLKNDNKSEMSQNVSINVNNDDTSQKDIKVVVQHEELKQDISEPSLHYPDLASNEKLSDVVLKIILKQVEDNNKMIELTVDELKEVIKTVCNCDEVLIDCDDPSADAVTCCGSSSIEIVFKAYVKKILLKYNNKAQLEDFKMHYNELKIITEDYKININEVTKYTLKSK